MGTGEELLSPETRLVVVAVTLMFLAMSLLVDAVESCDVNESYLMALATRPITNLVPRPIFSQLRMDYITATPKAGSTCKCYVTNVTSNVLILRHSCIQCQLIAVYAVSIL